MGVMERRLTEKEKEKRSWALGACFISVHALVVRIRGSNQSSHTTKNTPLSPQRDTQRQRDTQLVLTDSDHINDGRNSTNPRAKGDSRKLENGKLLSLYRCMVSIYEMKRRQHNLHLPQHHLLGYAISLSSCFLHSSVSCDPCMTWPGASSITEVELHKSKSRRY
jgi:hypothetical protein